MAGAERETAIIIARNVRHAVAGEIRCGVALYRAEDKLFCYWCLVNYSRSNGLNQRKAKANKHPAQGNALGLWTFGFAP